MEETKKKFEEIIRSPEFQHFPFWYRYLTIAYFKLAFLTLRNALLDFVFLPLLSFIGLLLDFVDMRITNKTIEEFTRMAESFLEASDEAFW